MIKKSSTWIRLLWISTVLILVSSTGCSTTVSGSASPNPKGQPTQAQLMVNLPGIGVPRVQNPLTGFQRFEQEPCSLLISSQLKDLKVSSAGEKKMGSAGPECDWLDLAGGPSVGIQWIESDRRGLTSFYESKNHYEVFERLTDIEGHPVLNYGNKPTIYTDQCLLLVGVTDDLAFQASGTRTAIESQQTKLCDRAYAVATMALQTMKGGS